MALVRGVEFTDAIAPAVKELTNRFVAILGEAHCYTRDNHIKFAMSPPQEPEIADGVIMRIGTKRGGALLKRARPPKGGPKEVSIDPNDLEAAYAAGAGYIEEMQRRWKSKRSNRRNPPWAHDELILALELYFRVPPWTIGGKHAEITKLSAELKRLSAYLDVPDAARFRNLSGTYMKLMNFESIDPSRGGKGLKGGGKNDRDVWQKYANSRGELTKAASAIRAAMSMPEVLESAGAPYGEDITEAIEGAVLTRLHRLRERISKVTKAKKNQALKRDGTLICEVCEFDYSARYGDLGRDYIECHHTTPLSELPEHSKTTLADLALVCANCHRMIHRRRQWLSVPELRNLLITRRAIISA